MEKRNFLFALFLIILLPHFTMAQTEGISVTTNPPGAEIVLEGEATVSGVSPAVFKQGLAGRYQLRLIKPGYENYSTSVLIDPNRPLELNVKLSPKTRFKAAARSLFIPGWGQKYSDKGSKGFMFQLGVFGAGIFYLVADNDFQNKYDTYLDRRNEYNSAATIDERQRLWDAYSLAKKEAYDAEGPRQLALKVTAGFWALNVLDALLFFPDRRETLSYKGFTIEPEIDNQRVGLALTTRF